MKRKLDISEIKLKNTKNKLYNTRKKLKVKKIKIMNLKEELNKIYKEVNLGEEKEAILENLLDDSLIGELNKCLVKKPKQYSDVLKKFTQTLHFYSPKEISYYISNY